MRAALVVLAVAAVSVGCAASPVHPKAKVKVRGTPPDATVVVDDQPVGPLRVIEKFGLALAPGRHRITVEKKGYFPWDRAVEATLGEPITLDVVLEPIPE